MAKTLSFLDDSTTFTPTGGPPATGGIWTITDDDHDLTDSLTVHQLVVDGLTEDTDEFDVQIRTVGSGDFRDYARFKNKGDLILITGYSIDAIKVVVAAAVPSGAALIITSRTPQEAQLAPLSSVPESTELADIAEASTDATGSVLIPAMRKHARYKVDCTCSASITWTLNTGTVQARAKERGSEIDTDVTFKGDDGPWPFFQVSWSGNAGNDDVFIDATVSEAV